MKKILLLAGLALAATTAHAQTAAPADRIVKLNGENLTVNITAVGEQDISFTYPGEKVANTINKNVVKEIDFASGRVQMMTTKIVVRSEADWANVLITTNPDEVKGLVRKGEVRAKATGATTMSNQANIDAKATERIKKAAAVLGAHIVLLQAQTTRSGMMGMSTPNSLKQGVAYSYE